MSVCGSATDIYLGFDGCGAIYIGDSDSAGVLGLEFAELAHGEHVCHGAAGVFVGDEDSLCGSKNFSGFGHEVHAAEDNDIGVGSGGFTGEVKGVTNEVSDVLNFGTLVVVSEDDGVALRAEGVDAFDDVLRLHGHSGVNQKGCK